MHARHARLPPAPPQYVEQIPPGAADDFHHAQLPRAESRHSVPTAACEPVQKKKRGVLASMRAAHRFLFRRREKTKPRASPCAPSLLHSRHPKRYTDDDPYTRASARDQDAT